MPRQQPPPETAQAPSQPEQPVYRSGVVARMAGMPVSTLRVWEQRYQAVGPSTAASGYRLYGAAEVERVVLLRQLTEQGHAIGALAGLDMDRLRQVARTQAAADAAAGAPPRSRPPADATARSLALTAALRAPLRVVVVGQAMARRLQRAAVLSACRRPPRVVAVFDALSDAVLAAAGPTPEPVDLLLWHTASLQDSALPELAAAQEAWAPCGVAVSYRFAGAAVRDAFANTGATVVREPADDAALGAWLAGLEASLLREVGRPGSDAGASAADASSPSHGDSAAWPLNAWGLTGQLPPTRRFDDATLTEFAGLPSGVACNCPGHVAELLMQIASFEAYSGDCSHRSPADAELHAYLQRIAGVARVLFETALERVALAEGWTLP